ncbi:hypothetical protein [Aquitalea sp.]|jgi:hypothetical protein|uniref:hypothetical protein n=1 Tax=Aquitalea sp. TaxID=1872623 RepID=UPI00258D55BA|nr:hypothetical protein [Aquitalea sp.]
MVTRFAAGVRRDPDFWPGDYIMTLLLISLTLLAEALWLALDKFWLDPAQAAVLLTTLPDRDHC